MKGGVHMAKTFKDSYGTVVTIVDRETSFETDEDKIITRKTTSKQTVTEFFSLNRMASVIL